MSITLPNAATANTDSLAATAAATATAQAAFVASATVLINQAIALGFFKIEPFMVSLVTSDYITTYFQALGYVVTFPIIPPSPWNPCFVAGFPEVIPPGWISWNCTCGCDCLPPRIRISWSS